MCRALPLPLCKWIGPSVPARRAPACHIEAIRSLAWATAGESRQEVATVGCECLDVAPMRCERLSTGALYGRQRIRESRVDVVQWMSQDRHCSPAEHSTHNYCLRFLRKNCVVEFYRRRLGLPPLGRPIFSPNLPATSIPRQSRDTPASHVATGTWKRAVTGRRVGSLALACAVVALPASFPRPACCCRAPPLSPPATGRHPLAAFWEGPDRARTGMQDVDHKREPCPHRIIDGTLIRWRGGGAGAGPPPSGRPRPPTRRGGGALPLVGVV